MKKALCLILSVLTVLSAVCVSAFAADAGIGYSDAAVEKVNLTGIKDITAWAESDTDAAYQITSWQGIEKLAELVDADKTFAGKTVYLARDIVPEGNMLFTGIGTGGKHWFMGTFDGQGHVIDNFTVEGKADGSGFFGYVKNAVIKNLILGDKAVISNTKGQTGGIVGRIQGTADTLIYNCWNKAAVESTGAMVGGIAGQFYADADDANGKWRTEVGLIKIVIDHCTNSGKVTAAGRVGGIYGRAASAAEIKNCLNKGDVTGTTAAIPGDGKKIGAAGIAAESGVKAEFFTVSNCVNTGAVSACTAVGGIAALLPGFGITVNECFNYGKLTVTADGGVSDGIVGSKLEGSEAVVDLVSADKYPETYADPNEVTEPAVTEPTAPVTPDEPAVTEPTTPVKPAPTTGDSALLFVVVSAAALLTLAGAAMLRRKED